MLPRTVDGMTHVCFFRHALALDERRVKFLPEYAYGGQSLNPDASVFPQPQEKAVSDSHVGKKSSPQRPQTLEVWFAGTHSDMYMLVVIQVVAVIDISYSEGAETSTTKGWIAVGRLYGGWFWRHRPSVFARRRSTVTSPVRSWSRFRNLLHGCGGLSNYFQLGDCLLPGETTESVNLHISQSHFLT